MIGADNNIYTMPCGEPCDEAPIPGPNVPDDDTTNDPDDDSTPTDTASADDTTTDTTDDDSSTVLDDDDLTNTYQYIGCYGDQSERVLTGLFLDHFDQMTTEVCHGS